MSANPNGDSLDLQHDMLSFQEDDRRREAQARARRAAANHGNPNPCPPGQVQCSSCGGFFYDEPGNYCENCSS